MEPVTQDFVEQTADFMMHLTKKQLDERVEDLKKRQFNISSIIEHEEGKRKDPNKKDFIWKMAFTLVHCFESYKIKLPMISINTVKEVRIDSVNAQSKIDKELSDEEQYQKFVDAIKQPYYYAFVTNFVSTDKEFQTLFNEDESQSLCFMLVILGQIYSKTLERYS